MKMPDRITLRPDKWETLSQETRLQELRNFENELALQEGRGSFWIDTSKVNPETIQIDPAKLSQEDSPYNAIKTYFEQLQTLSGQQENDHYVLDRMDGLYNNDEYKETSYTSDYRSRVNEASQINDLAKEEALDPMFLTQDASTEDQTEYYGYGY